MIRGTLYICATPIGNLEDITYRCVRILNEVDLIAAEDTRVSIKLLNHYGIKKPLVSYYKHNEKLRSSELIEKLIKGLNIALISDAGMPSISDPGEELVKEAILNNINVVVIPGATALISALAVSGQSTGRFSFQGFLSVNKRNRKEHLEKIKDYKETLIFYEAPHKLKTTLTDLYSHLGNRKISIIRELTKKYEQRLYFTLEEAISYYKDVNPKGEFVLVIEGSCEQMQQELSISMLYEKYNDGKLSEKEIFKKIAVDKKIPKKEVYKQLKILTK